MAMEAYFRELATLLDRSLYGRELYTCRLDAEASDFVRLNRGKVRQPGSVTQCYLGLHLIDGNRHAEQSLTVSGDLARDREPVLGALARLRGTLAGMPDDPHLSYATDVRSSRVARSSALPPAEAIIDDVLEAARDLDLVGLYAGGPVYRGFANSLGQRNWHEVTSFSLQWSLYHRADKAVKSVYGGFVWDSRALGAKMAGARERLALLTRPSKSLEPGRYRAFLTPSAMEELASMLCWGGFSGRALQTRQSCLFRLNEGSAQLDPAVSFSERTADGIAPAFQDDGFDRPSEVPLIDEGRMVGSLVSPRTAREYLLTQNGANASETPESLEMKGGTLTEGQALALLDTGLYIGNLHYLNFSDRPACRVTGMTRFASFWVEGGSIVAPVDVMRFDDTVYRLLGRELVGLTAEQELLMSADTYHQRSVASMRLPGAVVREMAFTL